MICYLMFTVIAIYVAGKLVCLGRPNCSFSLFHVGDTNQSNKQ